MYSLAKMLENGHKNTLHMSTTSTSLLPIQQEVAVVIMQLVASTTHFHLPVGCWTQTSIPVLTLWLTSLIMGNAPTVKQLCRSGTSSIIPTVPLLLEVNPMLLGI
jgi:hypothetical protein